MTFELYKPCLTVAHSDINVGCYAQFYILIANSIHNTA